MGTRAAAATARSGGCAALTSTYAACLAASGDDPYVRWQVDPVRTPHGWVLDEAVAFERLDRQGRRTVTVVGTPAAAALALPRLVPTGRPVRATVPRGTLAVLGDRVRVGDGADWDWLRTDVRPAQAADERRVVTVTDDDAVRALLAVASPRHSAVPGDDEVRRWVGVRADDGTLLACAAHTEAVPGVPHLASIATHPSVRGRGLGALVTGTLTQQLLDEGSPVVTLGMYADNDVARRMYLRLGYRCDHEWSSRAVVLRAGLPRTQAGSPTDLDRLTS